MTRSIEWVMAVLQTRMKTIQHIRVEYVTRFGSTFKYRNKWYCDVYLISFFHLFLKQFLSLHFLVNSEPRIYPCEEKLIQGFIQTDFVCLFVCLLFICLKKLKYWQLFSWCGRDIPTHPFTNEGQPQHRELYPLLCSNSVPVSHRELMNMKDICEAGPSVYSPCPRRLEGLTICGCKDSTFFSVILRSWVLVRP